jgi:hypothetical protein
VFTAAQQIWRAFLRRHNFDVYVGTSDAIFDKKNGKAMNESKPRLPMIATSNGWTPIGLFDLDADYARQQNFLVWVIDRQGHESFDVARIKSGRIFSALRGSCNDTRVGQGNTLRLVAFKLIEAPDRDALHRISQRCEVQFPLMAWRPPQPKLKIGAAWEKSYAV